MRELVAIVVLLVLATANYARITVTNYGDSALNCGITVTVHLIAPGNYAGITVTVHLIAPPSAPASRA
jgi:hypothetical protein